MRHRSLLHRSHQSGPGWCKNSYPFSTTMIQLILEDYGNLQRSRSHPDKVAEATDSRLMQGRFSFWGMELTEGLAIWKQHWPLQLGLKPMADPGRSGQIALGILFTWMRSFTSHRFAGGVWSDYVLAEPLNQRSFISTVGLLVVVAQGVLSPIWREP